MVSTIVGIVAIASLVIDQIDDPPAGLGSAMGKLLVLTAIIHVVIAIIALLVAERPPRYSTQLIILSNPEKYISRRI